MLLSQRTNVRFWPIADPLSLVPTVTDDARLPAIQALAFGTRNDIRLKGGRHFLGSLERRASIDSLTALTIILRLNHERGDFEQVWECAKSIFRVLLIIGNEFNQRGISARIFTLYRERVSNLARFNGCRMYLENCNYPVVSGSSRNVCKLSVKYRVQYIFCQK